MNGLSIRVTIADDHPTVLAGIVNELKGVDSIQLVGTAHNSTELILALEGAECDVVVSDYAMPGGEYGDGMTLISFIRRRFPDVRLVVLTMMDNPSIVHLIQKEGVFCILSKSDATGNLVAAIQAAYVGGKYFSPTMEAIVKKLTLEKMGDQSPKKLTERETEVVRLFASGMTMSDVAARLHRAKQTVSTQKASAMRKLGIANDVDLIRYAIETNIVPPSGSIPMQSE